MRRLAIAFLVGWFLGSVAGGQMQKREVARSAVGFPGFRFTAIEPARYRDSWVVAIERLIPGGRTVSVYAGQEGAEAEAEALNRGDLL